MTLSLKMHGGVCYSIVRPMLIMAVAVVPIGCPRWHSHVVCCTMYQGLHTRSLTHMRKQFLITFLRMQPFCSVMPDKDYDIYGLRIPGRTLEWLIVLREFGWMGSAAYLISRCFAYVHTSTSITFF